HSPMDYGEINVKIEQQDKDYFLIVADNGIGMSPTIMANDLLDFGNSYWKTSNFDYEYKGIVDQGFKPIGKFGIGFFSAFMLGVKITVTSWKYGESKSNIKTLDFYDGLNSIPILRNPNEEELDHLQSN